MRRIPAVLVATAALVALVLVVATADHQSGPPPALGASVGLSASATPGDGTIGLSWSSSKTGRGFEVLWRVDGTTTWSTTVVPTGTSKYTVTGLTDGKAYDWQVVLLTGTTTAAGTSTPAAVGPTGPAGPTGPTGTTPPAPGSWTEVFDDEFNGTSLNTTNWAPSWFGGGSMNNVTTPSSNVSVSGGYLNLTESNSGTAALVSSNPSGGASKGFQFGVGYYAEARICFTTGTDWDGFWTDGQSWPADGEADIVELLSGHATSNYHSNAGASNGGNVAGNWFGGACNVYALDRESSTNTIYYNDNVVRTYSTDDGGALQYLIFNVGSGGATGVQMKVDWVHVWQKASGASIAVPSAKSNHEPTHMTR